MSLALTALRKSPLRRYGRTGLVSQIVGLVVIDVVILAFNEVVMLLYTCASMVKVTVLARP